jgi:Mu transposase, C-terminal domain
MLDQTTRQAILTLRDAGNGIRAIARALGVSRIAVKRVLAGGSASPPLLERAEKAEPHRDEILALYAECKGNLVRVHEELETRGLVTLSYPALTAFCRKHGIGHEPTKPAGSYAWAHTPGKEMQHDTSPHDAHIGGALRRVQTASLVLCHSHRLFFQFYPRFTRFECKLFLNDGAQYHDGTCEHCMVDNSHVIVLSGTGKAMIPVPEMEAFARRLSFLFIAHEKGDANRSAGVERPFHHIENNFLAGRKFTDFADANRQAREWCDKINAKVRRSLQTSSNELYRAEWPALRRLPPWLPEVYLLHQRIVDLEGYIHVDGHIYSVPYQLIGKAVEVRETKDQIRVFRGPREVAVHDKTISTVKQRKTLSEHRPPRGQSAVHVTPLPEERELAAAGAPFPDYAAALKKRAGLRWPLALRRLAQMRHDYPPAPLTAAIETAAHYGLYDLDRLERIILRKIATAYFVEPAERDDPDPEPSDEG